MFNRLIKTALQIHKNHLHSVSRSNFERKQKQQKIAYDKSVKVRPKFRLSENEKGYIKWLPGKIVAIADTPRSYIIKDEEGSELRKNSEFLRKSLNEPNFQQNQMEDIDESDNTKEGEERDRNGRMMDECSSEVVTRSGRVIRKPKLLNNFVI